MAADDFNIADPRFADPVVAAEYLEAIRWPDGPVCPHCGETERTGRLNSKATTRRLHKCYACRKQFTVMVGTIFESSHVPLNKWLAAFYLLCSSKKGMSAHQLHRMIGVTYKTAWFMFHRIREAMKEPEFTSMMGGGGGTVEVDETYIGGKPRAGKIKNRQEAGRWRERKRAVVTLVERDGRAHSFRVANVTTRNVHPVIDRHISPDARLVTDEHSVYRGLTHFDHHTVNHSVSEYVRGDVTTNTVEGYFATFKRGLNGTYHHISEAHLGRYLAEFDFRYNHRQVSDSRRTVAALQGAEGKRLKYRQAAGNDNR